MKNPVFDKDLTPLFRGCDNADLDPLVEIILTAPGETLTLKETYREHSGDHKSYIDEIVYEITSLGGNTLANLVRGHGIPYAEMVRDVARKLGVHPRVTDDTKTLEEKTLLKVLEINYEQLDEEDRVALAELMDLERETTEDGKFPEEEISRKLGDAATSLVGDRIQNAIELAARSARIRQMFLSTVRASLAKVGTLSLGGPISWAFGVGQTVYELFGPNYARTVGLVAQVGLLRQKYIQRERDAESIEEIETELVAP